jgi:hypothetical protein
LRFGAGEAALACRAHRILMLMAPSQEELRRHDAAETRSGEGLLAQDRLTENRSVPFRSPGKSIESLERAVRVMASLQLGRSTGRKPEM